MRRIITEDEKLAKDVPIDTSTKARYEVDVWYGGSERPYSVRVSFELLYPDWCKFQSSKIWHRFLKALEAHQTEV